MRCERRIWNPYKLWEQHRFITSPDSMAEPQKVKIEDLWDNHVDPNTGNSVINSELYKHVESNQNSDQRMKVTVMLFKSITRLWCE